MHSGIVVPVMRYQTFNWTSLGVVTEDIIVADNVPIAPFAKIGLSVRVHKLRFVAGTTMQLILRGTNPSNDDGADFVFGTDLGNTPTLTSTTTAPTLLQLSTIVSDVQHPMLRLILRTIGNATAGVNVAILSGDLVMRTSS
jgi:hypothetical protein